MEPSDLIDLYLEKPYWVIDLLPKQVPADSQGQYFNIEKHFLSQPQFADICRKFANVLLKLNCYYDFTVLNPPDMGVNPAPEQLVNWLTAGKALHMLLASEESMIAFNGDDLYMTLYNPSESLLQLITPLALSEGLFAWKN